MHLLPTRPLHRLLAASTLAASLVLAACGTSQPTAAEVPDQSAAIATAVAATAAAQGDGIATAVAATVTARDSGSAAQADDKPNPQGQNDASSGKDAGDASESAMEIQANTDAPYTGTLAVGDQFDYYKLNIAASSVVSIEFQSTGKDGLISPPSTTKVLI